MIISIKQVALFVISISFVLVLQACGNAEPNTDNDGVNDGFTDGNLITVGLYGGLKTEPTDNNNVSENMEHKDLSDTSFFPTTLTREEKLCKKYLGQPQTQGLALPNNYREAVDYLRKALFFFPDDPSYMTSEQKELFKAPCFWSGMKVQYIYGGYTYMDGARQRLAQFSPSNISSISKNLDASRYYVFTRRFFDKTFNQTLKRIYCESTEFPSPYNTNNLWAGHGEFIAKSRNCGGNEVLFYSDGESNNFLSQYENTQLSTPNTNSKFVSEMEALLAVRNMRFGSIDGYNNYSYIPEMSDQFLAMGTLGARGVLRDKFDGTSRYDTRKASYEFNALSIISAIKDNGEIVIDLTRPKSQMFDINDTATNIGSKATYKTDWTLQPNEHDETKNITSKVQYWGWQTAHTIYVHRVTTDVLIHEMLHNMGYAHGELYTESCYRNYFGFRVCGYNTPIYPNNAIDIPYYIGDIIGWEGVSYYNAQDENVNYLANRYYKAVNNGVIPEYYSDPKRASLQVQVPNYYEGDTILTDKFEGVQP